MNIISVVHVQNVTTEYRADLNHSWICQARYEWFKEVRPPLNFTRSDKPKEHDNW